MINSCLNNVILLEFPIEKPMKKMLYDFKDFTVSYYLLTETGDDHEACEDWRHPNIHTREGTGKTYFKHILSV